MSTFVGKVADKTEVPVSAIDTVTTVEAILLSELAFKVKLKV